MKRLPTTRLVLLYCLLLVAWSKVFATASGTGAGNRVHQPTAAPTSTSFSPSSASLGATITITGSNYTSSNVTDVTFNGVSASFTVVSTTRITALVPCNASSGNLKVKYSGITITDNLGLCTISSIPVPHISASGSTTICPGDSVLLTSNASAGWLWSTGATTKSITVKLADSYSVQTIVGNCTSGTSTATVVNVNPATTVPTISATNSGIICNRVAITLTSSEPANNLWSTGETTQNISVALPGSYTVRSISASTGCTSATSLATIVTAVTVAKPSIAASGSTNICSGGSVTLTSSLAAGGYLWNTGATSQSITVSGPGSYSVQTISGNCTSAVGNAVTVTEVQSPATPTITESGATTFCSGNSITLSASAITGDHVGIFAGTGSSGSTDGTGTAASFSGPFGMRFDALGNLYLADYSNNRIRKITPAGQVSTFAGSSYGNTNGQLSSAKFAGPKGIAFDASGNMYVADYGGCLIRKITPSGTVGTFAGSNSGYADGSGLAAQFAGPTGMVMDAAGNLYVTEEINNAIRKITPSGMVSTLAGGTSGYADGTGTAAKFNRPMGIDIDINGNLYVADYGNHAIRKITAAGVVTTIAGNGISGYTNGAGSVANFNFPSDVKMDAAGNLFVADLLNHVIRKINTAGIVDTYAGDGSSNYKDGSPSTAAFSMPTALVTDGIGNLYVSDQANNIIQKIATYPTIDSWQWSNGQTGQSITVNASGNYTVRAIAGSCTSATSAAKIITVNQVPNAPGFILGGSTVICQGGSLTLTGTGAPAGGTYLWSTGETTGSISVNTAKTISVRVIANGCTSAVGSSITTRVNNTPAPIISTGNTYTLCNGASAALYVSNMVAYSSYSWYCNGVKLSTNPGSISTGKAGKYQLVAFDANGCKLTSNTITLAVDTIPTPAISTTYQTEFCAPFTIQLMASTSQYGNVSTFAGTGTAGNNNGGVTVAMFNQPYKSVLDTLGNMYVADANNNQIRKITQAGVASTFAGTGTANFTDGTGTNASFNSPRGLAIDLKGNLYVSDYGNHSIRKITAAGIVTTLAGTGNPGNANGNGNLAEFSNPTNLTTDPDGNVYVADYGNNLIRKITPSGVVSTLAGSNLGRSDGNGTAASFNSPSGITYCNDGYLYVSDFNNNLVRKVSTAGVVSTFAGNSGLPGFVNGTGTMAKFDHPIDVTADKFGNLYIADLGNNLIRKINASGVVTTYAGINNSTITNGPSNQVFVNSPTNVSADVSGNLYFTRTNANKIFKITPNYIIDAYIWSGGSGNLQFNNINSSGTYSVKTVVNGCTSASSNSIEVTVWPQPNTPSISASGPLSFCSGGSVTLTSSAATGNIWSNGATTQSITVNSSGNYQVSVAANGCTSETSPVKVVTVVPVPSTPTITANGTTSFCYGGNVTLTATGGTNYIWSNGASTNSITVAASGNYTVRSVANGCTSAAAGSVVVVLTGPSVKIDTSGPTKFCPGERVTLTSSGGGNAWLWSTGATTQSISVNNFGNYWVRGYNNGCGGDTAAITLKSAQPTATITANGPTALCPGSSVTLTATGGDTYIWSDNSTGTTLTTSSAGNYSVTAISNGCTSSQSAPIPVTVNSCANNWTGATSGDWADPANWSAGSLPNSTTDVTLTTAQRNPVIATTVNVKNLTVSGGVSLTVNGTLNVAGNLVNNGAVSGSGTLKLNGTTAQTISGTAFDVANLTIANTTGATLTTSLGITGTVNLTAGTLNANGNLVLRSNNTGTALIDDFSAGNTGTVTGTVSAERYFPGTGWHMVAAPVTGSTLGTLGLACSNIRFWSEALNVGVVATTGCESTSFDVNTPLAVTQNSGTKYTLSGTANTGDYTVNLVRGAGSSPQRGFNYVSNPYPSPISWTSVIATSGLTANSNGTAYIWNPATSTYGNISSAGVTTGSANNLIQSGQGFLVRRNTLSSAGTASMTFKNSHRVNTNAAFFIRKPVTEQSLRLVLKSDISEDDILLYTSPEANVDMDNLDAEKLHSYLPVASISSGDDLAINALPTDFTGTVALNISAPEAGIYHLSVKELGEVSVTLEDKKTGTFTALTAETSLDLNLNENNSGRFALHYGSNSGGANNIQIFAADKLVTVILPTADNAVIEAVNTLGQVVSTINATEKVTRFALPRDGVYVIRVKSGNGVKSGKVVY